MSYRGEIDGLRTIAVTLVIAYHAGFSTFSGGFIGVDIFFVISGYLITSIIWTELSQNKFSFGNFYARRTKRIFPLLFFIICLTLPFAWTLLLPHELESFLKSVIATLFFVSNIFFWGEVGYFDIAADLKPLLHTWSLSVEEQFYLIYPLMISLAWGFGKKIVIRILIITAISSFLSPFITFTDFQFLRRITESSASFFLLTGRFWELLLGGGLAIYLIEKKSSLLLTKKLVKEVMCLFGIFAIILTSVGYVKGAYTTAHILLASLGTALIIIFCDKNTIVGKFLGWKICSRLGLLSYSAYLWHQPIFVFFRVYSIEAPSKITMFSLCLSIIPISYLSWRYIENPFRKGSISNRKFFWFISIVSLIIITFVSIQLFGKNEMNRYASHELEVVSDYGLRNEYVWEKKNQLNLTSFKGDYSNKRILFIGDSYSGDVINAVIEANTSNSLSLSSVPISPTCLSVFEKYLSNSVDINQSINCGNWVRDEKLLLLLEEANFIVIAGNWKIENVNSLVNVYMALRNKFGRKITVVGVKGFSNKTRVLQSIPLGERAEYKIPPKEGLAEINQMIKTKINEDFFDILTVICPAEKCPAFTPNLQIISYDQGHLTKAGAHAVGDIIKRHYPFRTFMN